MGKKLGGDREVVEVAREVCDIWKRIDQLNCYSHSCRNNPDDYYGICSCSGVTKLLHYFNTLVGRMDALTTRQQSGKVGEP